MLLCHCITCQYLDFYQHMSLCHCITCQYLDFYQHIVLHGFLYVQLFEVKHRCSVFRYIGGIADHH
jgi:hypothetical protein